MIALLDRRGCRARLHALRHAALHPAVQAPRLGPVHPRRRTADAPHQARHAHDGRHRLHHRLDPRLPRRSPRLRGALDDGRGARARHDGRPRARRIPRRLPQDPQAAQPRPRRLVEDRRPGDRRDGLRPARDPSGVHRRERPDPGIRLHLGRPRHPLARPVRLGPDHRRHPVRALGQRHHGQRLERRERRRRARRPRERCRDLLDLGLHLHRLLAGEPVLLQPARSTPTSSTSATRCAIRSTSPSSPPRSRAA